MKKLINRPEAVVAEMVEGLVAIHPGLRRLPDQMVLVRADTREVRDHHVAVISGGGSGHEPAHAGYVGRGMLSAAVAGDVFTSPSPDAVLAAIRAVAGPPGALLIVKNYTGDRLNFGLAAELARSEGIAVEVVIVADDVALADSTDNAGRRGIAGTILVHKVAGAAAEHGLALSEVAAEARAAADSVRTMGVALSPCTVPAAGKPGFLLGEDEIELGLGIHGEPGIAREALEPADSLVDRLLNRITAESGHSPGDRVALLVNNLGGTTMMELAIVARRAIARLEQFHQLQVERVYAETFLSALEMAGVSLSVMSLDDTRLSRLDAPTGAPAWPNAASQARVITHGAGPVPDVELSRSSRIASAAAPAQWNSAEHLRSRALIEAAAQSVRAAAPRLNELDRAVGDGDLGISMTRAADAVLEALPVLPLIDPAATLESLGLTLQKALGGTSGPLYGVFFLRAANRLKQGAAHGAKSWAAAFQEGVRAVAGLGGAAQGDRTMLDALIPASEVFAAGLDDGQSVSQALGAAVAAARAGAEGTKAMLPRRGRSSYLGERALGHPDPGAVAVAIWLEAIRDELATQGSP